MENQEEIDWLPDNLRSINVPREPVEWNTLKNWSQEAENVKFFQKFPQMKLLYRCTGLDSIIPELENVSEVFPHSQNLNEKIGIWYGDITQLKVDAIVNAAHPGLCGGGGVDGYIHMIAGEELMEECMTLGGCEMGEAKLTKGHKLPAKYVIHTVGPHNADASVLESCYKSCLNLMLENNFRTIAFPCISTGHYKFPIVDATKIALNSVHQWLEGIDLTKIDLIIFSVFNMRDEAVYNELLPKYYP